MAPVRSVVFAVALFGGLLVPQVVSTEPAGASGMVKLPSSASICKWYGEALVTQLLNGEKPSWPGEAIAAIAECSWTSTGSSDGTMVDVMGSVPSKWVCPAPYPKPVKTAGWKGCYGSSTLVALEGRYEVMVQGTFGDGSRHPNVQLPEALAATIAFQKVGAKA